jgi:excisionase family DNA binding protein
MRKPRAENPEDVFTVEQVADYLQLNKMTVYKYIREGKLPASRIGKSYRVRNSDLAVFLEVSRVSPAQSAATAPSHFRRTMVQRLLSRPAPAIALAALAIGGAIANQSALSYLGFGTQPPTPSRSEMLQNAQDFSRRIAVLPF